ncbi:MAG TPA: nitrogenase cofactor biosynthesis protein NifB [Desulfobulbaceae bacterium]|nr:MAG: nitrogenase cofactor biosynthesis protein NifB [Deltaproteobacteria bacterium RIFOXYD12_FULL_53_23]HCC53569.1 nitrogenase cofactor biosynthesis protein NifB [Desulfobulbaceae bacterium]
MHNIDKDLSKHPCFNPAMKGQAGRVHLPVAPNCNIKCNYCDRKYDCVNESRPGVTSTILSPEQALVYTGKVLEKEPRITVAGIAGPGDPFANGEATMETMRLINKNFPQMILCLASNGLAIGPYVPELAELNVSHVTITINAVDPAVGAKIYNWVRDGKVVYHGLQAAELLLSRQLEAVKALKAHGITVKINSIMIPGINDQHIVKVAEAMQELGADLFNCMAMFPNVGTPFGTIREPAKEEIALVRGEAEKFLPQMRHCTRCRADAVGLLDQDRTEEMRGCLSACAQLPALPPEIRPYVAVATMEGVLVNQHLGEANRFLIYEQKGDEYLLVEERSAPRVSGGLQRWTSLARALNDCRAVLVSGVGETPREILEKAGLKPVEMGGFIMDGLKVIYEGGSVAPLQKRKKSCASGSCVGSGGGCS